MIIELIKAFGSMFVIMDPFGSLPFFISLTKKMSAKQRTTNFNKAIVIATILLFIFLLFGSPLLLFFGVSINSFMIAGGIILLIFGVTYVLDIRISSELEQADVAVVPIATPLISGPGVLTAAMINTSKYGVPIAAIASILSLLLTYIIMRFSTHIYRVIGKHGSEILSKIMGMILVAMAIQFIYEGIIGFMR